MGLSLAQVGVDCQRRSKRDLLEDVVREAVPVGLPHTPMPEQEPKDTKRRCDAASPGFYAIADACSAAKVGLSVEALGRRLLSAGVGTLQVRAKRATARELRMAVEALRLPCQRRGVPLIVNDRADVAAVSGADGVHVGRSDIPLIEIRKHFPRLVVGVSTHSLQQLHETLREGPDYVAFGPIFSTITKPDAEPPLGLRALSEASQAAKRAGIPLVAIGGIDGRSAPQVYEVAPALAAIGAALVNGPSEASIKASVAALSPP